MPEDAGVQVGQYVWDDSTVDIGEDAVLFALADFVLPPAEEHVGQCVLDPAVRDLVEAEDAEGGILLISVEDVLNIPIDPEAVDFEWTTDVALLELWV